MLEANGSILFRNVKIEPAEKGRSLNSRPTWRKTLRIILPLIENRGIASLTPTFDPQSAGIDRKLCAAHFAFLPLMI